MLSLALAGQSLIMPLTGGPYTALVPLHCSFCHHQGSRFQNVARGTTVSVVMNQVLAPCILGERLTRIDAAATGIIVIGIALSTAFGVHTSANFTIEKLLVLWSVNLRTCLSATPKYRPCHRFIGYFGACPVCRYSCHMCCGWVGDSGIFNYQVPSAPVACS